MKTRLLIFFILGGSFGAVAQNIGIGSTSFTPDASSILELRSTSGGFLMPRMTEAQRDAISNPASGLMIYQTNNTPGYYYYDGASWQSFGASIDNLGDHTATQNLVVGPGLGITDTDSDTKIQVEESSDDDNIRFDVAGSEAMVIDQAQNVGIGIASPTEKLHVEGNVRIGDNAYLDDDGSLGGNNDDWIRLNGYVEMKTNSDNYGLVIRDKDNNDFFGLTQKNGWSYLSDNAASGSYFMRASGANAEIRGDLNVRGSDVYDNSGNLRLSGEDNVFITMDYNNNDNDSRAIRFGKNSMGSPAELARIQENGNVGIGTTSPNNLLDVAGTIETEGLKVTTGAANGYVLTSDGSGNATWQPTGGGTMSDDDLDTKIQVEESNDEDRIRFDVAGVEAVVIDNSGNVGVGVAAPSERMEVRGNISFTKAGSRSLKVLDGTGNGEDGGSLTIKSGNAGTAGNSAADGGNLVLQAGNQRDASLNNAEGGNIELRAGLNSWPGPSSLDTDEAEIRFFTDDTQRMKIQSDGSVGIGDSNPIANLQIYGNGMSGFSPAGGGAGPEIGFARGGFYAGLGASIQMIDYNGYSGGLAFNVHRGANNGAGGAFADNWPNDVLQAMTIMNNGNVGVGSTNPSARLHVAGDARITDLGGSGTRMVVADANGDLSTQSIPSGGSSPWSESGSNVYRSGGRVGIGTSSPSYRLHVTQSNTNLNVVEFINTSSSGLVQFNDNLATNNSSNALESWTNKNNNGGGSPYGVFGGSYSSSNGSNGGGVYGHVNSRRGYAVLGVRNGSGGQGYAGIFLGRLGYSGGVVNLSDRRLKRDVKELNEAIDIVKNLRPTTYYFDTDEHPHYGLSETLQYGFIAQEIEEVLPDIVIESEIGDYVKHKDKNKSETEVEYKSFKGYDFPQLIPILTRAIQEQQEVIEKMEEKNQELEVRLAAIEARLKK